MSLSRLITNIVSSMLVYVLLGYSAVASARFLQADSMSVREHVQMYQEQRLRDPAASVWHPPLELNPYAAVANNPLRWIDPTGQAAAGAAVGGGIGSFIGGAMGALGGGAACTVVAPGFGTIGCGGAGAMQGAMEGAAIGAMIGSKIEDMCKKNDKEKNCRALYDTIVRSCWAIPDPRKRQRFFEAAKATYQSCMAED